MASKPINRRDFLRLAGAASLYGFGLFRIGGSPKNAGLLPTATPPPPTHGQMTGQDAGTEFLPDAEVILTAVEKTVQILPGFATRVLGYEGKITHGSAASISGIPNSYLGPVIRVKSGTRLRLVMKNQLREETVLHPHGMRVPENCDGSPMSPVAPGQESVYDFQIVDRAGPYWFHPHPMTTTPEQVYLGLSGLLTVWDEEEEAAIPWASSGEHDIPVIIQDRLFDQQNQLVYQPNMMWGMLGNRILVNGTLDARCSLEPRGYRLRLLNGSNARTYKLAWDNGMKLTVIGTDGGLLPEAVEKDYVMLSPGERVDVWADFSGSPGRKVTLKSLAFNPAGGMMGGRGMGMGNMGMMGVGGGLPNGAAMDILTVMVGTKATQKPKPGPLPALAQKYSASNVENFSTPRPFTLSMGMMMSWWINGRTYEMTAVAPDEEVIVDKPTAWEFINLSPIPHPMHLHNTQFQIIERTPPALTSYAEISDGFVDSGWKDTVLVWPGERVKIAMAFGPNTGMYMYHCHILEHEDMGMMRNIMVLENPDPG